MNTVDTDSIFPDEILTDPIRPKDLVDLLEDVHSCLDPQIDDLAGLVERAPAEMHSFDIDRLMELVVALRNLHDVLGSAKKAVNKASVKVEENGCKVILDNDELIWRCEAGTFSPKPRGFFSVNDGEKLLDYLDGNIPEFCRLMKSKSELGKYCDGLLENGEPLPPGISKHLEAKLNVRRK